jgi:hypothetical protein
MVPNGKQWKKRILSLDHEDRKIEGHANLNDYITRFYKNLFGPSQDNTMSLDDAQTIDIPQVIPKLRINFS